MWPFMRSSPCVGVDLGGSTIRAVALRRDRAGWSLLWAGQTALPAEGDDEADQATLASAAIRELLSGRFRRARVSSGLPDESVTVRRARVATGRQKAVAAVRAQAAADLAASQGRTRLGWSLHGVSGGSDAGLLLAAAPADVVRERATMFGQAGHRLDVLDVESLALTNAYFVNYPDHPTEPTLLIHLRTASATLAVVEDGGLAAAATVRLPKASLDAVSAALERSLVSILPHGNDRKIQRTVVSGERPDLEDASARVAAGLDTPAEILNPVRELAVGIDVPGAELIGPAFAIAVGFALRRKGDGQFG